MTKADLHIHSSYSDGSDSVEELANNIKNAGIKTFALTDHDTVAGCAEMEQIIDKSIRFIPSVELTCKADWVKCHILGYNCNYNNKKLLAYKCFSFAINGILYESNADDSLYPSPKPAYTVTFVSVNAVKPKPSLATHFTVTITERRCIMFSVFTIIFENISSSYVQSSKLSGNISF